MLPEDFLKKVRSIEIASRRLMKEGMSGDYRSAFRGSGMQFKEFRNYVYGDDVRHISWNVSARTIDPVLKTFEEERERILFLVVDVSPSLRQGPWAKAKAERLAEVAATLAISAADAKDKLGLLLYTDQIETVINPAKGRTHVLRVIRDVLAFEAKGQKTNPNLALRQLDRVLKKQSIVFLLSDFEVFPDERVLSQTRSLHDFTCINIEHPSEWTFPHMPGFIELETAELKRPVTIDAQSDSFREYMNKFGNMRKRKLDEHFKKSGVDLLHINTVDDYVVPLKNFFQSRHKRRG